VKKYYQSFLLFLFLLIVFVGGFSQHIDPDLFDHFMAGKIIAHYGITSREMLTNQLGESLLWIPFEWGFQLLVYLFVYIFGLSSHGIFVGILSVIQIGLFYLLLKRVINLSFVSSFIGSLLYFLLSYNFLVARPQIITMSFFITEFIILFLFLLKNKNYLFFLLPLVYIWTNFHASFILGLGIFLLYTIRTLISLYISKDVKKLNELKILLLYFLTMLIVSFLPPGGLLQYRMLGIFIQYASLIRNFTIEWQIITENVGIYFYYIFFAIIPTIGFIYLVQKRRSNTLFALLPFLFFIIYGFAAFRNIIFGFFAASILWAMLLQEIRWKDLESLHKMVLWLLLIFGFFYACFEGYYIYTTKVSYFPTKAVSYIQKHTLKGNIFNQFVYGGFLEYVLYPRQLFMDGRTIPYPCCRVQDYYALQMADSTMTTAEFNNATQVFFDKYNLTIAILVMDSDNSGEVLSQALQSNPSWKIVFSDQKSKILVKK